MRNSELHRFSSECNCFDHSSACVYNATVAALRQSLDIHGNYSGGGVCIDCQVIFFIVQDIFKSLS